MITGGYQLPAKYVIHTVGPVWHGGSRSEPELLRACYRNCMALAESRELESIAFPAISTGVYRYPRHEAAEIAISEVRAFSTKAVRRVVYACFDEASTAVYAEVLERDTCR